MVIVEREEAIRYLHAKGCYTDTRVKFYIRVAAHIFPQLGMDQGAQGNIKCMRIICHMHPIKMNKTFAV